jgi:hypothetical protein
MSDEAWTEIRCHRPPQGRNQRPQFPPLKPLFLPSSLFRTQGGIPWFFRVRGPDQKKHSTFSQGH